MSTYKNLHVVDLIALIVVIVGGLNWMLVGLFEWDLVAQTFGRVSIVLSRIVYVVVGLAAIYAAVRAPALSHYRFEPSEHGEAETRTV